MAIASRETLDKLLDEISKEAVDKLMTSTSPIFASGGTISSSGEIPLRDFYGVSPASHVTDALAYTTSKEVKSDIRDWLVPDQWDLPSSEDIITDILSPNEGVITPTFKRNERQTFYEQQADTGEF